MFVLPLGNDAELRLLEMRHAEELFTLVDQNRFYLRQWLGWVDSNQSILDSRSFIRGALQQFANNNGFQAGVWFGGALAGVIGYNYIDWQNSRTEFGYWLGAPFQGHGLITRACQALIDYTYDDLRLNRIEILCAAENTRSRAIPERLGFTQEGIFRQAEWLYDHFVDLVVYAMLADEWRGVPTEAQHSH
ncbi:MAG TPA: GNAT family protein [Ktedonobacterales bacterium]|jgi:ribosomal-protein-serine acetyltransferase